MFVTQFSRRSWWLGGEGRLSESDFSPRDRTPPPTFARRLGLARAVLGVVSLACSLLRRFRGRMLSESPYEATALDAATPGARPASHA